MDASPDETLPEFCLAEVRKHDSPEDLWMILYNKIYNVSTFPMKHPGGAEVLFDCGGVDATEAFEDVAHSKNACEMLAPFLIGRVNSDDARIYKSSVTIPEQESHKNPRKKLTGSRRRSIIALAALGVFACTVIVCLQRLKWANIVT